MRYEDDDFYVDLVFYHSVLKCHVLIDLKLGELTHGDVGQMDRLLIEERMKSSEEEL